MWPFCQYILVESLASVYTDLRYKMHRHQLQKIVHLAVHMDSVQVFGDLVGNLAWCGPRTGRHCLRGREREREREGGRGRGREREGGHEHGRHL